MEHSPLDIVLPLLVPSFKNGAMACSGHQLLDAAAAAECINVSGDLIIANRPDAAITGLSQLTSIGGSLLVFGNPELVSLSGLANITTIGGELFIGSNAKLESLDGLGGSLLSLGGDLLVMGNAALVSLDGLGGLNVSGSVSISGNEALSSAEGEQLCASTIVGSVYLGYHSGFERTSLLFCEYTSAFHSKLELQAAVDAWLTDRSAALITYGNISQWDTSNVTDMSYLFCAGGAQGPTEQLLCDISRKSFNDYIGSWDVSRVTTMQAMFSGTCETQGASASQVWSDPSAWSSFNQPLEGWVTSKVTNMEDMFLCATSFDQDLAAWDTTRVTSMRRMFKSALYFNGALAAWNTGEVRTFEQMFYSARSFNRELGSWDVGQVEDFSFMFYSTVGGRGSNSKAHLVPIKFLRPFSVMTPPCE